MLALTADFVLCVVWERGLRAALPARRPRLLPQPTEQGASGSENRTQVAIADGRLKAE